MAITDTVKKWFMKIAFGKILSRGVKSAAKAIVAFATGHGIALSFQFNGIDVDVQSEAATIIAVNSILSVVREKLKEKYPDKLSWL